LFRAIHNRNAQGKKKMRISKKKKLRKKNKFIV
jgi:hypothetical protein